VSEGFRVRSAGTVVKPGDSLETNADIDNFHIEFLAGTIVESLVLHEDHVSYFEATDEVLNRGAKVATASPNIFDVSNLIGVNFKGLSQPSVVELNALILEELVIIGVVENLLAQHDEARVVPSSQTNIVQVVETSAELGANQGVRWGFKLASDTVGLEAEDSCSDKVDIIAPSCNDGVPFNGGAGHTCSRETLLVAFPGLSEGHLLAFADTVANKAVFACAAAKKMKGF